MCLHNSVSLFLLEDFEEIFFSVLPNALEVTARKRSVCRNFGSLRTGFMLSLIE